MSMGASPRTITSFFLLMGFAAGFAGTSLGVVSGLFLAVNVNEIIRWLEGVINWFVSGFVSASQIFAGRDAMPELQILNTAYYLEEIPIRVDLLSLTIVGFMSTLISTLATYFPAKKAGKMSPLEVIRRH